MNSALAFPVPILSLTGTRKAYVCKFVPAYSSAAAYAIASDGMAIDGDSLAGGKLFTAKFNPNGTGRWIALAANARAVDSTRWYSDYSDSNEVYFALAHAQHPHGQIVRMRPSVEDANATAFTWDMQGVDADFDAANEKQSLPGLFIGTADLQALLTLSPAERIELAEDLWDN
jgi:secreted PhoX family phosphatase